MSLRRWLFLLKFGQSLKCHLMLKEQERKRRKERETWYTKKFFSWASCHHELTHIRSPFQSPSSSSLITMKASSWFLVQFLFIIILCSLKSCNSLASLHFMSRGCCSSGIVISVMPFQSRVLFLPTSFLDCLTAGLQVVQVFDTSSSLTIPWFTPIISFTSALMIILVLDANHSRKSLCNQNESRHETLLSKITSSRLEKPVLSAAKLVLGEQNHFLNYTLEMTGDSVMSLERVKCSIVSPLWAPLVFLQKQNKKTQKSILFREARFLQKQNDQR